MTMFCPPELINLPPDEVYRDERERDQCGWIGCEDGSPHGRFCDKHRQWHAARLERQVHNIIEAGR